MPLCWPLCTKQPPAASIMGDRGAKRIPSFACSKARCCNPQILSARSPLRYPEFTVNFQGSRHRGAKAGVTEREWKHPVLWAGRLAEKPVGNAKLRAPPEIGVHILDNTQVLPSVQGSVLWITSWTWEPTMIFPKTEPGSLLSFKTWLQARLDITFL